MGKLLVFFIAGSIGILLRFFILGKFDLDQLFLLLLFPIATIFVYGIMRYQIRKDASFQATGDPYDMQTKMAERYSTGLKVVTHGKDIIGEFNRFYKKKWHRVITEVIGSTFHINLTFNLSSHIKIVGINEHALARNSQWEIYENNKLVGQIRTDHSLKNVAKLKETFILELGEETFNFYSLSIGSETKVEKNNLEVANGKRRKGSIYGITVNEANKQHEEVLFAVFVLFNYVYEQ
ncbi:tubby C-terminal domain-like protein [Radiobacillus deserti]|uniref:Tubby C-terminal domain-containing protein n=1 Tax=Radiobacillus deserti TaxID=2594883 RepID=A0A516KI67_9BACI|nr:hypothetical protein [Radiobacillus deserti]QDP41056.1 hypothetical protein FN924_13155 [Radiobacillus deserti]